MISINVPSKPSLPHTLDLVVSQADYERFFLGALTWGVEAAIEAKVGFAWLKVHNSLVDQLLMTIGFNRFDRNDYGDPCLLFEAGQELRYWMKFRGDPETNFYDC